MKKLTIILLLFCVLMLHAQSVPKHGAAVERWEIVTDIYIGVQTETLSPEERQAYGKALSPHQGLRIKNVIAGSPAEKAGLRAGDLILGNNGAGVSTMEDLLLSLRNTRPGELVHFNLLRDGARQPAVIRVAALPEPVVVAHASVQGRELPGLSAMAENQGRIARLLSAEVPDLKATRDEFAGINRLFPSLSRPGQIRLYYETDGGYITVTAYPAGINVTVQRGQEMESYHLRQQGDTLPEYLRRLFSEM